jgi:hypothetical protein
MLHLLGQPDTLLATDGLQLPDRARRWRSRGQLELPAQARGQRDRGGETRRGGLLAQLALDVKVILTPPCIFH